MGGKANEPLLNGAITSIPNLAQQTPPTPHRRFRKAIRLAVHVAAIFFVACLAFWFFLRPKPIDVFVSTATLSQFTLTETHNLNYSFSLNLVFRNPNKRGLVKYKWLHATSSYHGARFGWVWIRGFRQSHDSSATVSAEFDGESALPESGFSAEKFERDAVMGLFDLDVRVHAWLKYKFGWFKTRPRLVRIECELKKVKLGDERRYFRGTRCHVHA